MKPFWEDAPLKPNLGKIDARCKTILAAYYAAKRSTNADWMRVVWNIVENSDVAANLPGALKLIDELAAHRDEILEFLASDVEIASNFALEQVREEREKARLICKVNKWYPAFREAETYPFLKGRISVLLEASGYDWMLFIILGVWIQRILRKQDDGMVEFFKSYLDFAQECDLPLTYDHDFFNPEKWKQMFFNDTDKKGVVAWLQSVLIELYQPAVRAQREYAWLKAIADSQASWEPLDWAANLRRHWNAICPEGPNEYRGIAKFCHGWGDNKVFLYRTRNITRAQLISSSLRGELIKGLSHDAVVWYNSLGYDQEIELDNGLKVVHHPDDMVDVYLDGKRFDKIGGFSLSEPLTTDSLKEFVECCLEYK